MDQTQLTGLTNFIWNIADNVLRDVYVRGKYRDVILPMTVLRRLDAVLEPTKKAVLNMKAALDSESIVHQDDALRSASGQAFYNTSPFLLRDLKSRASQQALRDDFEAYLDGFSPNVQDILTNFEFRNQIPRLSKADALGQLIEKFLDSDLNISPYAVIQYFYALSEYLAEIKSPYKAIVAFSGEPEYKGEKVTEAKLNGFPSNDIADRVQEDPYRFLICANKFQTGYDEPLLHTMYVDKALSGIMAVQTLSRLNRAHPKKHDVFVLDFQNDTETIEKSFAAYYRTTILSKETDPNKLHALKGDLDAYQVYSDEHIDELVGLYLSGADRDKLDPILDQCVAAYVQELDEDGQVDFKGKAKAFTRTYDFLSTILPYGVQGWERLSIFLNFLISKLPAPVEEDLAKGILDAIDMDSYRAEKKASLAIALPDADAEIEPVPTSGGGRKPEPELDRLSNIVKAFNDQFGGLFADAKRMELRITAEIPLRVAADQAYQNAKKNSDRQNARIEHDKALKRVITALFKDDAQLFKQFQDNESFKHWLTDTVFGLTYDD